jgi:hypothetical protein
MRAAGAAPLLALAIAAAGLAGGCDSPDCTDSESLTVIENGSCAPAPPVQLTLGVTACQVYLDATGSAMSGLPRTGAVGQDRRPLRQGDFVLYGGDGPDFRLCRATRVDFQLDLDCVDGSGSPVCQAVLTEPPP